MNRHTQGWESIWTVVDGLRLHTRRAVRQVSDDAPAIVFVHGLGVSGRYMMPTAIE